MAELDKIPLPQAPDIILGPYFSNRILGDQTGQVEKDWRCSKPLRTKRKSFIGTLNVNTDETWEMQGTRFADENHFDSANYNFYKGKPAVKVNNGPKQFNIGFAVHKSVTFSVLDFSSPSERLSTLSIKSWNMAYTLINVHAPTND